MQDGLFYKRCFFWQNHLRKRFQKILSVYWMGESIKGWLQPTLIETGRETSEKHLFHQDNPLVLLQSSCNVEMCSCSDKTAPMAAFIRTSSGAAIVYEMAVPSRLCHIQATAVVAASISVVLKTFLSGPKWLAANWHCFHYCNVFSMAKHVLVCFMVQKDCVATVVDGAMSEMLTKEKLLNMVLDLVNVPFKW